MKNIFKAPIIFFLFCFFKVNAQEVKPGDYIPNPINKKFEGTWVYKNDAMELKIVLHNNEKVMPKFFEIFIDQIVGKVSLIKSGKTIINNEEGVIGGTGEFKNNTYVLRASFNDVDDFSGASLLFVFPDKDNLNSLQVTVTPYAYTGMKLMKVKVKEIRIPKTFTLIKIK